MYGVSGMWDVSCVLCVVCGVCVCPLFQESLLQCLQRVSCLLSRGQQLAADTCTSSSHHYLGFSSAEQRFHCTSREDEDENEDENEGEGEGEGEEEEEEEGEKEAAASSSGSKEEDEEEEKEKEASTEGSRQGSKPPR